MTSSFEGFDGAHDPDEAQQDAVFDTPKQGVDSAGDMAPSIGDGQCDDPDASPPPCLPPPDYQSCILTSGIDTAMLVHDLCREICR